MVTIKDNYGREHKLEKNMVLANDVTFTHEYNPHRTKLYIIGHEYGAICAVWSNNESEALDTMVDNNIETFLIDIEELEGYDFINNPNEYAFLGNACEAADLTYCWIEAIDLSKQDTTLLLLFAEARGGGYDTLDF